jgi:hypothetical protein
MTPRKEALGRTAAGRNWATLALDPFHDFEVPVTGYPDRYSGGTVVQLVKKKVTLKAPPNVIGTGKTWSCMVSTLPLGSTDNGVTYFDQPLDHKFSQDDDYIQPLGTVNVARVADGATYGAYPATQSAPPIAATPGVDFPICSAYSGTDDGNNNSMSRLVAGGFEVHNDTAALHAQGSVTVFTAPNEWSYPYLAENRNLSAQDEHFGMFITARSPPTTPSEAASLPNSRTWKAVDGALVPFRLDIESKDMNMRPSTNVTPDIRYNDNANHEYTSCGGVRLQREDHETFEKVHWDGNHVPVRMAALETSGAYFSGLSEETVLTLDMRFFLEVAPTAANQALVSMATPSASHDRMALDCYADCLEMLPPGVPVHMNAAGDWWRMVSKVASALTPALTQLHPAAGAASTAVALGTQALANRKVDKTPKSKSNTTFRKKK